jgi:hypothetical protein
MTNAEIIKVAIENVKRDGPPAIGAVVATEDEKIAADLVAIEGHFAVLEWPCGRRKTVKISEVFDVNKVHQEAMRLKFAN